MVVASMTKSPETRVSRLARQSSDASHTSTVAINNLPRHAFHRSSHYGRSGLTEPDFTSTAVGKYSECMFHSPQPAELHSAGTGGGYLDKLDEGNSATQSSLSLPKRTIGTRPLFSRSYSNVPSSSTPMTPYQRHRRSPSSAAHVTSMDDGKRLVYQFLNADNEMKMQGSSQWSERSKSSQFSVYRDSKRDSLSHLVFCDLQRTLSSGPYEKGIESLNCDAEVLSEHYEDYITRASGKLENSIKEALIGGLSGKETEMRRSFGQLDALGNDIASLKTIILGIRVDVEDKLMTDLQYAFDNTDPESFVNKLSKSVNQHLKGLEELEERISRCKEELALQKDALQKLEATLRLNEKLRDTQRNMRLVDKIRDNLGILIDLTGILLIVCMFSLLRKYLTFGNSK
ncbi:LAMI_0F06370g1_1 [Lachancea mirantina]|uniref:LAMI_0F06370g1_1 n=1 Tax=Lachancea mirantina TaxID=1230905 RepID=A0A1G4JZ48_9SACH|nr:LAMI_0F06370g1_1 [Lachancea mirantina]